MGRDGRRLWHGLPFLALGLVLGGTTVLLRFPRLDTNTLILVQALGLVERHYVEPRTREELTEAALEGVVHSLDRYCEFLPPEATRRADEETQGAFVGIGVQLDLKTSLRDGVLTVLRPFRSGPARAAGVLPGDRIVAVDGKPLPRVTRANWESLVGRIRGPAGTRVTLTLERRGGRGRKRLTVTVTRRKVHIESVVAARLVDPERGIGYARITDFKEETPRELTAVLGGLKRRGLKAFVLDLRNNGGGLLRQAAQVADRFLADGVIVATRGRHPEDTETFRARPAVALPLDVPVIVLVNGASASAAEVVAGALQDRKRALVVGERTYGKGVVQSVYRLGRTGATLKITTSRYYTPAGRCIDRIPSRRDPRRAVGGIVPDVVLKLTAAEEKAVLGPGGEWERWQNDAVDSRTPPPPALPPGTQDRQLLAALALLRGEYVPSRTLRPPERRP